MSQSTHILRVSSITKMYPNADAYSLKDVSFDVIRGEKLGIFGPNGAGKLPSFPSCAGFYQKLRAVWIIILIINQPPLKRFCLKLALSRRILHSTKN